MKTQTNVKTFDDVRRALNTVEHAVTTVEDGAVIGPDIAVSGNLPVFADTTGKLVSDSGKKPADFALSAHTHPGSDITSQVADAAHAVAADDGVSSATGTSPLTLGLAAKALTGSIAITPTSNGGAVALQASTPGTQQTGNVNLSGTVVAGVAVIGGSTVAITGNTRTYSAVERAVVAATGSNTNIPLCLVPKGSGGFSVLVPDGTGTGGNARGTYSVDLQQNPSAAANVASGTYSINIGGTGNKPSGSYSVVLGGAGNWATADYAVSCGSGCASTAEYSFSCGRGSISSSANSFSSGYYGLADLPGAQAHANGRFAAGGDAQKFDCVFRKQTSNTTPTELALDGGTSYFTLSNGQLYVADIQVIGTNADHTNCGAWSYSNVMFGREGATSTIYGAPTVSTSGSNSGTIPTGWAVSVGVDDANDRLTITVTGGSETIYWVAVLRGARVVY